MKIVELNELSLHEKTNRLEKLVAFGGEGQHIHFAHANAYPIKTYTHFLRLFTDEYKVSGYQQRPCWSASNANHFDKWEQLGDDLISAFDANGMKRVIGMGHSMGGIATLYAANKRPDLFRSIILIEPVIMERKMIQALIQLSYDEQLANNPMAQIAQRRRDSWSTKEEAQAYFESKPFFKEFTTEAKRDFILHGLAETETGFTLSYPRDWEARIYSIVPDVWEELEKLTCPALVVKAEKSDVIRTESHWNMIKEVVKNATCIEQANAGHLIPQEKPIELRQLIADYLNNQIND